MQHMRVTASQLILFQLDTKQHLTSFQFVTLVIHFQLRQRCRIGRMAMHIFVTLETLCTEDTLAGSHCAQASDLLKMTITCKFLWRSVTLPDDVKGQASIAACGSS